MFQNIFKNLVLQKLEKNEPLFYAGDNGDKFFIVLGGSLRVCIPRTSDEINALYDIDPEEVSQKNLYNFRIFYFFREGLTRKT